MASQKAACYCAPRIAASARVWQGRSLLTKRLMPRSVVWATTLSAAGVPNLAPCNTGRGKRLR